MGSATPTSTPTAASMVRATPWRWKSPSMVPTVKRRAGHARGDERVHRERLHVEQPHGADHDERAEVEQEAHGEGDAQARAGQAGDTHVAQLVEAGERLVVERAVALAAWLERLEPVPGLVEDRAHLLDDRLVAPGHRRPLVLDDLVDVAAQVGLQVLARA